jgi:tetratricopeptide (TPR) repeat protein
MRLRIFSLIVVIGAVMIFGSVVGKWWVSKSRPHSDLSSSASYVGDQSCRACHATIYESYKRTAMGRAWYSPTHDNVIEDYTENNHSYDSQRDLHYEMLNRDGQFLQREYRLDASGAVTHELIQRVDYIVGSGEHVRSYVADTGGFLTQLPISWYSDDKRWGLSPGYELSNHRFSRPVGPGCIACHNDYPNHFQATLNQYASPVPSGIGCERCHGPAEWHVRQQRDGWEPPEGRAELPTIANPARLIGDLRDDVCFQCHLQGDTEFVNPGKDQYGFRPGLRLADFRSVYLAEVSDPEKFGIASHATRMVQSRCFIAAQGQFNCITCHDPHVPLREVPAESYRIACLSCHSESSCKRPADSSLADEQNDCVACHMPRGRPTDVQHTVFTDHWIRRPVAEPVAPHKPAPAGPVRLQPFWSEPKPNTEQLGLAHVSFAFAKGGRANLDKGIELLRNAAGQNELHLDGWRKLGMAALATGDSRLAGTAFEKALQLDPNDGKSRLGLGMAKNSIGDNVGAMAELESAIRIAPGQLEAYLVASTIHLQRHQLRRALTLLDQSLQVYPFQPEVLATMGSVYCQESLDLERGIDLFERAIQLEPDNVAFRASLSFVYMAQGQLDTARAQLQQALRIDPDYKPALLTLARIHMVRQESSRAMEYVDRLLRLDPKDRLAKQLLSQLQNSPGPE